jgi:HAD superfamily hydrolase (TIGR01549 family)
MIKALIFDFSDTLVNSVEARAKAFHKLVQHYFPLLENKSKDMMLLYWKTDLLHPSWSMKQIIRKTVNEFLTSYDMICRIDIDTFYKEYRKEVEMYLCIRQSFIDIFPQLKERYNLFILTIESRKSVEKLLQKGGIIPHEFDEIITRTELSKWGLSKMSIQIYERICRCHHLTPEECVMIGDSPLVDILPAHAAGLNTMLYSSYADKTTSDLHTLLREEWSR